ncbi:MAG: pyridoxamine 5'-phosphate oxidase family protein [Bacteroidota bacterium]|nr:pyridoxamine 5'-phosphate oxidase family protein [Bacteroidota bacterium]
MGEKKDLFDAEAIEKMKDLAGTGCFMVTHTGENSVDCRPMGIQLIDDQGNFWFFSEKNSAKNNQIHHNPKVELMIQNSGSQTYLSVTGQAVISQDREKIKELWNGWAKTWFPDGEDDENLSLIMVETSDAYYWDNKHNQMISLLKIAYGAITGAQNSDDGVEGKIKP